MPLVPPSYAKLRLRDIRNPKITELETVQEKLNHGWSRRDFSNMDPNEEEFLNV